MLDGHGAADRTFIAAKYRLFAHRCRNQSTNQVFVHNVLQFQPNSHLIRDKNEPLDWGGKPSVQSIAPRDKSMPVTRETAAHNLMPPFFQHRSGS
jgi:hypothetical protein